MRRLALVTGVAVICFTSSSVLVAQSAPPLTPFRGLIDHVSQTMWGGVPGGTSDGSVHAISGDGRFIVFSSGAWDLVSNDYNGLDDIFMRDRMTGVTTRVSVADNGSESNDMSQFAAISANGRHIAFSSGASNLVANDTNGYWDVFVRDLDANRTVRVSMSSVGTQGDADSYAPSISADGRYVAFISAATTFASGTVQYGPLQVYVHDRDTDGNGIFDEVGGTTTSLASPGGGGGPADQYCARPRVSADGRYVLFESGATNLDPVGNPNGQNHLYVYDRLNAQTTLIDRAVTGGPSSWGITWQGADMSDDGRFITYSSISPDIVPFDMNWLSQVFQYDAMADPASRTTIASRRPDGALADGSSYYTTVSADGRYVAFMTEAANLASPAPLSGSFALVVRDGLDGSFTRVDVLEGSVPFDGQYPFNPSLSADGTAIAFQSNAQNAVDGVYSWGSYHIFVATAFSTGPASASYPQQGGAGSIDVNATAVSGWNAASDNDWIVLMDGAGFGAGPRTVQYLVSPNANGIVRDGRMRLGSKVIAIHQVGDGDATPPEITPIVTGSQTESGWYISDVTISWVVNDPDSEIISRSANCTSGITIATDTIYAPVTCEATSHGGTSSAVVVIRRDTTPPTIAISMPQSTIYSAGGYVQPSFDCSDAFGYSGVGSCAITEGSSPLDMTPGHHTFTVTATDQAFNTATRTVEYLVGSDICVMPPLAPSHLKGWWKFDGNLRDSIGGRDAIGNIGAGTFQNGVVNQGWDDTYSGNFLWAWQGSDTVAGQGLTVAAWVLPRGQYGAYGTIVSNPLQYRIARYSDGTLRWAFNTSTGFDWVNTGVQIQPYVWSHVAVTYKDGFVRSYLNGRLVHSAQLSGTLTTSGNPAENLTIGGRNGVMTSLIGTLDDLMIFDDALSSEDVDGLVLSGGGSLCRPFTSTLAITVPPTIVYGTHFQVAALLTDGGGRPLPNRPLTITSDVTPGYVYNVQTDANGSVAVQFPINSSATVGDYPNAIAATFGGDDAFSTADAHASVTLLGGTPTLNWSQPAPITYGTALGSAQLTATTNFIGTLAYSPPAGTVLDAGTRALSVTLTPEDTAHWAARTVTTTIVVNKAAATVDISAAPLFYTGQPRQAIVTVRGVGDAELHPFTVLYNGGTTLPVNAGAYALQVTYGGSVDYEPVSATGSLVINRTTPIMGTFGDITDTYDGMPHGISVNVAGVNDEWLTPVTVTYNGSTTTPINAGVYAIEARYDGSANYNGVSRSATLTILKAAPYVTWFDPADISYGTALGAAQLSATSHVAGIFTYSPPAGTVLGAGLHTLTASFMPTDAPNYETASASRPISVSKANPQITWYAPAAMVYGTPLGPTQLNATASASGTFAYTPGAGTVLSAGTNIVAVTFTPDDTANYNGVTASVPVSVAKAASAIAWSNPADIVYGTAVGVVQLNATAIVAGTLAYSPAAGAVLNAGTQALSVTFTPDDAANYNAATASVTLNVAKAASTITWSTPAGIVYGTALGVAQLNATANVAGTFAYSPAAGTVLSAGSQTLSVTFTPTDSGNYNGATASVTLNVAKAASTITWSNPANIVYGTALGVAQLNATANVAGTFAYSPAAGTVLSAGSQTLSVTFTPTDSGNYNGATASVTLNVAKAASTITWSNPANIVYGTALGVPQFNATANVAGAFAYSPAAGTVPGAGPAILSVTFTPSDSANYNGSTSSRSLTVTPAPLTIRANDASKLFGAPLPGFSATATGFANGDSMSSLSGSLTLSTAATVASPVGSYAITPSGVSSSNYVMTFANGTLTIARASTATSVAASPNPDGLNQAVTLTATVSVIAPGAGTPGGVLQFFDGGTLLGTATLAGGAALLTTNGFSAGSHTISATYSGDGSFNASSGTGGLIVKTSAASSTTAVTSSANPSTTGQNVTLTATLTAPAGLSGSVSFYDGATLIGSVALSGTTARLTTASLTTGGHAITARYLGNATIPPSTSPTFAQHVRPSGTQPHVSTTALVASPSPATLGSAVTLSATVTGSNNKAPSGVVLFMLNGFVLEQRTLSQTGTITAAVSLVTSSLPHGTHRVEAVYLGDATFRASVTSVSLVVN